MKTTRPLFAFILMSHALTATAAPADPLEAGFRNPPNSAKPQAWWHWMNGNVTKAAITADLESMAHAGIAGADIINVANKSIVNIPAGPVNYLSPEWLDLVHFSATEADRLGLRLGLANSAGWSGSGGPWITPENSMKKVVWSETEVAGGSAQSIQLPQPPTKLDFYRDIVALAFPASKSKPAAIALANILNLTDKLDKDGRLSWQPPGGDWTVLRFGYTSNGRKVRPAPKSGTGLETDKLSRQTLDAHWAAGIQPVLDKLGPLAGKVMTTILLDSYEAFSQDWTAAMPAEFQRRRGYDLTPYLPVLAGRVVVSRAVSDRFLWDFKRTIADLFADNYYGYFAEKCHHARLNFACEPYGNGGFEALQAGARADIPMGEFWVNGGGGQRSPKLAASIAHTHGQNIAGAEAFTGRPPESGRWQNYPGSMKAIGDAMWCAGINRFYFHSIPLQPWLDKFPGMTMGKYGTHFGWTTTWWAESGAWMKYIARSQFLLQQGRFVADVLIFPGETPSGATGTDAELRTAGYDFDLAGTDLIGQLRVQNDAVVVPSGLRYRVLVLNTGSNMTPALAAKVRDLVRNGATVVAAQPDSSPSLENYPRCDERVKAIAAEVWGKDGNSTAGEHAFGKGHVVWGRKPVDALKELGVVPDFQVPDADAQLQYIHRVTKDADIYFISHQSDDTKMVDCFFRVTGRQPELWNPMTGEIQPAVLWQAVKRGTRVTLPLGPGSSLFVVFRQPVARDTQTFTAIRNDTTSESQWLPELTATPQGTKLLAWDNGKYSLKKSSGGQESVLVNSLPGPITLDQSWKVNFTPGWGAPNEIELRHLQDWTKNPDPGVRYYSGTGTYRTILKLPAKFVTEADRIELDLGGVKVLAQVILNGQNLGVLWCKPFRVDITKAAKAGDNALEIRVVNLWPNRLIGDEQYPPDVEWARMGLKKWPAWVENDTPRPSTNRLTFTTWHHWNKDDPLLPSGLLGPVQVRAGKMVKFTR